MKVLTAAEMREVDRRTVEAGIPGIVLMENAAHRVVEFLYARFAPLSGQRIVVLCGKGNNGGDGMAIARQLHTRACDLELHGRGTHGRGTHGRGTHARGTHGRELHPLDQHPDHHPDHHPGELHVILLAPPEELKGDAAANYRMLAACGCPVEREIPGEARSATLVIDALLGTGVNGPATGLMLEGIRAINRQFPLATVVAVDIPSGMPSDLGAPAGEIARADYTVTFTAPKVAQVMPPNCDRVGELIVRAIGSPSSLYEEIRLSLVEPAMFRDLLAKRAPAGNKGTYGHALIVAGSRGKSGAAAMAGMAALRAGAGLVTVASAASAIAEIAMHAPELMTEPLRETGSGGIAANADLQSVAEGKTVIAMGPGLGRAPHIAALAHTLTESLAQPMVLDADALPVHPLVNALANALVKPPGLGPARTRILTPHPGEMARLTGKTIAEIQADRISIARAYATRYSVTLVLKGQRSVIAFPDGRVWINPTGTPAMGTGGTGDILTGLIAGFLAQFPERPDQAVAAAVYLHGLAGEMGARTLGEKCLIATDILQYLPRAMEECADLPHCL